MSKPKNPQRCPCCFRLIGVTRHWIFSWHKWDGARCPGTGLRA